MTDRRYLSLADLEAFVKKCDKLRAEGLVDSAIAKRLGVSRGAIVDRRKRWRARVEAQLSSASTRVPESIERKGEP